VPHLLRHGDDGAESLHRRGEMVQPPGADSGGHVLRLLAGAVRTSGRGSEQPHHPDLLPDPAAFAGDGPRFFGLIFYPRAGKLELYG